MPGRKLLLCFLGILIMLPILFSFAVSIGCEKSMDEKVYVINPLNIPEEESKEDEVSFGKEKNVQSSDYNISLFTSILESNTYLFSHSKPMNGNSQLPYNPPEQI